MLTEDLRLYNWTQVALLEELRYSPLKALQVPSDLKVGTVKQVMCPVGRAQMGVQEMESCPFPSITNHVVSIKN